MLRTPPWGFAVPSADRDREQVRASSCAGDSSRWRRDAGFNLAEVVAKFHARFGHLYVAKFEA